MSVFSNIWETSVSRNNYPESLPLIVSKIFYKLVNHKRVNQSEKYSFFCYFLYVFKSSHAIAYLFTAAFDRIDEDFNISDANRAVTSNISATFYRLFVLFFFLIFYNLKSYRISGYILSLISLFLSIFFEIHIYIYIFIYILYIYIHNKLFANIYK